MIDDIVREFLMNNLIIREWVNGGLLPLNISLVVIIGIFLWDEWVKSQYPGGWRELRIHPYIHIRDHYRRWHRRSGVPTACALIWIFAADAVRAGSAWYILWVANNKLPVRPPVLESMWVSSGFIVAGVIGLVASIRCIYLFTPDWDAPQWVPSKMVPYWRHWYWVTSLMLTFAFQIFT